MNDHEKNSVALAASADFSLSSSFADIMCGMDGPELSEKTVALLKQGTEKAVLASSVPKRMGARKTESGYFHEDGFLVKKPHGEVGQPGRGQRGTLARLS